MLGKGKTLNKNIEYIEDLPTLINERDSITCKATSTEYFKDEKTLLDLLKWNALYRIANSIRLFADEKYNNFSLWEKFYQKF